MSQTTGERFEYSKETRIILCFDGNRMIWAWIIDKTIMGLIRVPEGVNLISKMYCDLLESVLLTRLEDLPLPGRCI